MDSSNNSNSRLAVVIVVDGLRASALGTYGNTTVPTPCFDELASRSLVIEGLLSGGPTLADFYSAAWEESNTTCVFRQLVTDDASIASLAQNVRFDEVIRVEQGLCRSSQEVVATHAAKFFSQAVEQLAVWQKEVPARGQKGLLWIHFSGLSGPWDAPLEMREALLDEDDPPAFGIVDSPKNLQTTSDPDELLGYRVAYAAQVTVIEACLSGLVEAFERLPCVGQKLTMVVGSRGFALGEHGYVGHDCQLLYSEQLHLPWLIMAGGTQEPLPRVTGFGQPADVGATLAQWLTDEAHGDQAGRSLVPFLGGRLGHLRDCVVAGNTAGDAMIHTPAWFMTQRSNIELYAKPDDRWEANDVAGRCPEIVEQLGRQLAALQLGHDEPLAEELLFSWR